MNATDRLELAYTAGLAALAVATHPHPLPILAACAAVAAVLVFASLRAARSAFARVVHDFAPVPVVVALFSASGPVIAAANPRRWDAELAALDRALFGGLPDAWFHLLGRPAWLTDAASLAYASYYGVPVALGVALYRSGRRDAFHHFAFTVVATFLTTYVGYLLAPALGPRLPAADEAAQLGGGALSDALRAFLHAAEWNQLDAFPSGHTAVSLVCLGVGWRRFPRWRLPLAAVVAGILFSTVYLSLHYVIDLVAGAAVAAAMPIAGPALERWFAAKPRVSGRR